MYSVQKDLYPLALTEFYQLVTNDFVLNGAFCSFSINDGTGVPSTTTTTPMTIVSSGFSYTGTSGTTATVLPVAVTNDKLQVNFSFKKDYERSLVKDVHGVIYRKDARYVVEINSGTTVLDFIGHDYLNLRLTQPGIMTVEILRDVLGKVRAMYMLQALDKLHDVIFVPTKKEEHDALLDKIKLYIRKFVDKSFIFDICAGSTNDVTDKNMLRLSIRKNDGSLAKKDLMKIDLYSRKYEPSIVMSIEFQNDGDPFKGAFQFLDDGVDPFVEHYIISQDESTYFIKHILKIIAQLDDYRYIYDTTP